MTQAEALKWFADLFGLPADSISPESTRDKIPNWDSLGVLTLMAALDETFNIVTDDAKMRSLQKVGDVLDLLRQHGKLT
jgi:acyl carrier protein